MATILVCDVCDTRKDVKRHSWSIDRKMDAAGSMENISVAVDLCLKCENRLLKKVVEGLLDEKVKNALAKGYQRELEFGKRMWEEYRKTAKHE